MKIAELKNISKDYGTEKITVRALDNISFAIEKGDFISIMGPSGSGKSTLLHILGLLDKPSSGNYILSGKETSSLSDEQLAYLRNRLLGFIFQNFNLLPRITATENVILPLLYSSCSVDRTKAVELLERVGLKHRIFHRPNELSGGEQQRVAIARALINNPVLLLADEPTGNLDTKSAGEIIQILKKLNEEGITIVMVTHEPDLAVEAKRIIRMQDGKIIEDRISGKPQISVNKNKNEYNEILKKTYKILKFKSINNYFSQAFKSLITNKTRSFLSILGVLIGVACLITMLALGKGAREDVRQRIAQMGSNVLLVRPARQQIRGISLQSGSITRFTIEDIEKISSIYNVKKVAGYVRGQGQAVFKNKNWNTQVLGANPEYFNIRNVKIEKGRIFTEEENSERTKVAVIGKTVQKELFSNTNPVGEFIKINKIDFQIIGVMAEKGASSWRDEDNEIVLPLNTAMKRLLGKEYIDYMDVQVTDMELMERVSTRIINMMKLLHRLSSEDEANIEIRNMAEIQETITATMKTFSYLLGSIAFVSLLVGGIGIMNIMLVTVTERTKEIGLRKAIGATNADIMLQFIIESITICIIGGLLGLLFGSAVSFALAKFAKWSTTVSITSILISISFSFFIGMFFGIWPAKKASKLNPIDALRYE